MEKLYTMSVNDKGTIFTRTLKTVEDFALEYKIGKEHEYDSYRSQEKNAEAGAVINSVFIYAKNIVIEPINDDPGVQKVTYDAFFRDSRVTKSERLMSTKIQKFCLVFWKAVEIPGDYYKNIHIKEEWRTEKITIFTNSIIKEDAICNPIVIKG